MHVSILINSIFKSTCIYLYNLSCIKLVNYINSLFFLIYIFIYLCTSSNRQDSTYHDLCYSICRLLEARCSCVVRAFAHGAMGHLLDPSWLSIELFLIQLVYNQGCGMCYPVCGIMHIKKKLYK